MTDGTQPESGVDDFAPVAHVTSRVAHAVPVGQPTSVRQIAPSLLSAYAVEGGHAHLVGCRLREIPVVEIASAEGESSPESPRYYLIDTEQAKGELVGDELMRTLGLARLEDAQRPSTIAPNEVATILTTAFEAAGIAESERPHRNVRIVWCKRVEGKLEFTIGDAAADLGFAGWATVLSPPPFRCPVTGVETFRLAATSDGRIVAAEQLETCTVSGERLPRDETVRCAATDRVVAAHLTSICPASGLPVQTDWMVPCSMCQQKVSPACLESGRCATCRHLEATTAEDPRLLSVVGQFPELVRWRWLSVAESQTSLVVVARGIWQKRLLVIDRASGELRHAARGQRGSRDWKPIADLAAGPDL
ncbi:MAG: hypothetical protein DWQ42_22400 [Planctomycetota bacterium]|nr:MAG: hypothetical protein DWQ42_22400 [Planctomycetota bacterium]REK42423.1 MAG: hypothetical protein DWQ46_13075 [Planctomycetota bacterium]